MAFKAKNKNPHNLWRSKNLHTLVQAGIPMRIANDDRRFWNLVEEADENMYGLDGWTVEWITDEQASVLFEMLTGLLGEHRRLELLDALRRKLGLPQPPITAAMPRQRPCD